MNSRSDFVIENCRIVIRQWHHVRNILGFRLFSFDRIGSRPPNVASSLPRDSRRGLVNIRAHGRIWNQCSENEAAEYHQRSMRLHEYQKPAVRSGISSNNHVFGFLMTTYSGRGQEVIAYRSSSRSATHTCLSDIESGPAVVRPHFKYQSEASISRALVDNEQHLTEWLF